MENTPAISSKSVSKLPTSFSANSLDIGQQLAIAKCLPLMSESVTLDSLSTKSLDALPPFPSCTPPQFATIALGDHLKMFSEMLSKKPAFSVEPAVVLAAPTSPRLNSMLKECLSIRKWAESSTDWQPPGHVPWQSIDDENPTRWIPEGSLFSPESFAQALSEARTRRGSISISQPPATTDSSNSRLSHGSMGNEMLDMMRELKGLRSFFEDSLQTENALDLSLPSRTLALPALVVSNSQFTFPLALDSCQSISQHATPTLAHRRGRKAPVPLKLKKQDKPPELAYPNVPTPFLGSPSRHITHFAATEGSNKPALRVEDMITNLRLQCSAMALNTPPVDSSWNSRSILEPSIGKVEGIDKRADESPLSTGPCRAAVPSAVSPTVQQHNGPFLPPGSPQSKKESDHTCVPPSYDRKAVPLSRKPDDVRVVRHIQAKIPLHSAMVRRDASYTKPRKSVRFVLPQSEVEKDATVPASIPTPVKHMSVVPKSQEKAHPTPLMVAKSNPPPKPNVATPPRKPAVVRRPTDVAVLRNKTNDVSLPTDVPAAGVVVTPRLHRLSDGKPAVRPHSVTVSSPLRQSMLAQPKPASGPDQMKRKSEPQPITGVPLVGLRRSKTLGRHSLSRIMKGPMFTSRDVNKRATISLSADWEANENSGRRDTEMIPSAKKSRMPVPLRKILTRFK